MQQLKQLLLATFKLIKLLGVVGFKISKLLLTPVYKFLKKYRAFKKLNQNSFTLIFLSLIILAISAAAFMLHPKKAKADWFDDKWQYRQMVPISNSSGAAKTDFQTQITLDTSALITAGKVNSDCSDIRVTNNNGKKLDYWIEPTTCNTTATLIWTKVPSIPTTGADLYLYYGNASAIDESSTEHVFIRDIESAAVAWPMQEAASTTLPYTEAKHPADALGRDILIPNKDFTSSWTIGGDVTIDDADSFTKNDTNPGGIFKDIGLVTGKTYEVVVTGDTASDVFELRNGAGGTSPLIGTGFGTHTFTASDARLYLRVTGASGTTNITMNLTTVKQTDIPSSGDFDGTELLTDGDMEAADTSAWDPVNAPTLTKETSSPHGGSNWLKIAYNASSSPGVSQTILTTGKTYRVTGYAHGDGTQSPLISDTVSVLWNGTSSTDWQSFDFKFVAGATQIKLYGIFSVAGFIGFDDVSVTEISPLSGAIPTSASTNRPTLGAVADHLSTAYTFDGSNDYLNVYSSDLNSVFNPDEGTLVAWAKVSGVGVWTDGTNNTVIYLQSDVNNRIRIITDGAGGLDFYNTSGGTAKTVKYSTSTTDWFMAVLTWDTSADELKVYVNGTQQGSTQTGLGTWSGNLSSTSVTIGSGNASASYPWSGDINDVKLYSRALSPQEVTDLYDASNDIQAYYTDNYEGRELIRQYDDTVTVGTLASEEVGPSVVAYWKFDEGADNTCPGGSNDVCDSSSSGNDLVRTNATWMSEDMCISGKCLSFDGSGDYASFSSFNGVKNSSEVSVCAWVYLYTLGDTLATDDSAIFSKNDTSGVTTLLWYDVDTVSTPNHTYVFNVGAHATTSNRVNGTDGAAKANQWQYVCGVMSGANRYLYIDGKLNAQTSSAAATTVTLDGIGGRVGSWDFLSSFDANARIDEVKVYPYARTAAEVYQDYLVGAASAGSSAVLGANDTSFLNDGLVGYWPMDETSGTSVTDASGNANAGTLTSAQETGTSDGSGNSTTTLIDTDGTLSATNDAYNGMILSITDDGTCPLSANAERIITDYDGTSKTFTVGTAFSAAPDTCVYTVLHQVGGKFGSSIDFAENEYVSIADDTSLSPGSDNQTIGAWIKTDTTFGSVGHIYSNYGSSTANAAVLYASTDGTLTCVFRDGDSDAATAVSSSSINDQQWHQINCIRDGTTAYLYVDGLSAGSNTNSSLGTVDTTGRAKNIGKNATGATGYFNGNIDEVRVYNRALSASEVAALYHWAPGPVGYWDFDEGSGTTAFDRSGNGNNGTLTNSPTWTQGKYGDSLYFDGSSNYVEIPDATNLNLINKPFTISAWINKSADFGASFFRIFDKIQSGTQLGYGIDMSDVGIRMLGSTNHLEPFTTNTNKWYYITAAYDGVSTGYIYVDGTLVDSGTYVAAKTYTGTAQIAKASDATSYFQGQIDDVKVYNYARTPMQILQDMHASSASINSENPAGGIPEPIAYWSFDEQQGTTAYDSVGGYNGTLGVGTSAPSWQMPDSGSCHENGCLSFDGGDFVDNSNITLSGEFTAQFWYNWTPNSSFQMVLGSGESGLARKIGFSSNNTNFFVRVVDEGSSDSTVAAPSSGWHFVSLTRNNNNKVDLYVDGKPPNRLFSDVAQSGDFLISMIGTNEIVYQNFNGLIDEVKVYNFALTADQVAEEYNAGAAVVLGNDQEAADVTDGAGSSPVLEWTFDEKTGTTANDVSGNGISGTIYNGPAWTSSCKQGVCLDFTAAADNTGDRVTYGFPFNPLGTTTGDEMTMNMWLKPDAKQTNTLAYFVRNGQSSDMNFGVSLVGLSSGYYQLRVAYYDGTTFQADTTANIVPANEWTYLSMVWTQGTDIDIYLNGVYRETISWIGNNSVTSATSFNIGGHVGTSAQSYDGLIDDVKIYDYARTPAQIAYDYNRGGPIAWYRFDECQGSTLHDSSGNGYDGTITEGGSGTNTSIGTCGGSAGSMWADGASGKYSSSLQFDGTDDSVVVSDNDALSFGNGTSDQPFSFSMWINPTSTASNAGILSKATTSNAGEYYLYINSSNNLYFRLIDNSTSGYIGIYASSALSAGTWKHVVATYDGSGAYSGMKLYINGILQSTIESSNGSYTAMENLSTNVNIGVREAATYFSGQIDEVKIWNYTLSANQIKKEFNAGAVIRFE